MVVRVNRNDFCYFLAVFLVSFFKGFGLGSEDFLYKIAMVSALCLCLMKIMLDLKTGIERKKVQQIFFVGILFLLNYFIIKDITLVLSFFFCLAIRNTSLRTTLLVVLISRVSSFLLNIVLVLANLREENIFEFYREGVIYRRDFGFGHPNLFHYMYASIVVLILVLWFHKIKGIHLILLGGINVLCYNISLSRTGFFNVILALFFFVWVRTSGLKKVLYFFARQIQVILLLLTYVFAISLYKVPLVHQLDRLLTGRIYYSNLQIQRGISIFGRNFHGTDILFDNSYSMLLTMYGIFITFLFLYLYGTAVKRFVNAQLDSLILMCLVFSVYVFTESYMLSAIINLSLLGISKVYFGEVEELLQDF